MKQIDFDTMTLGELDEAKIKIEALLLENHRTMQRAEYLADEIESKRADLDQWQESLNKEQDSFFREKSEFADLQKKVLEHQERVNLAIQRVNAANRDPIEAINEALLLLELDEEPAAIAKYLREKRDVLDVKW